MRQPIGLARSQPPRILSPYHCLRLFKSLHAVTPVCYLNQSRVRMRRAAAAGVAAWGSMRSPLRVGFGSRTTLYRHLKRLAWSECAAHLRSASEAGFGGEPVSRARQDAAPPHPRGLRTWP